MDLIEKLSKGRMLLLRNRTFAVLFIAVAVTSAFALYFLPNPIVASFLRTDPWMSIESAAVTLFGCGPSMCRPGKQDLYSFEIAATIHNPTHRNHSISFTNSGTLTVRYVEYGLVKSRVTIGNAYLSYVNGGAPIGLSIPAYRVAQPACTPSYLILDFATYAGAFPKGGKGDLQLQLDLRVRFDGAETVTDLVADITVSATQVFVQALNVPLQWPIIPTIQPQSNECQIPWA
jgi:hypothetical protein